MRFISGMAMRLCFMLCKPMLEAVKIKTSAMPAAQNGTMLFERPMFDPATDAAMYMPNMASRITPTFMRRWRH